MARGAPPSSRTRACTLRARLAICTVTVQNFDSGKHDRRKFADRAAALVGAAAETFNDGLRAYYFSFALLAWFISPLAMVMGTLVVVAILYSREFRSDVLQVLRD